PSCREEPATPTRNDVPQCRPSCRKQRLHERYSTYADIGRARLFAASTVHLPRSLMMHRRSTVKRRALLACGIGIILAATHAQAIFIVNQPWARPAARGGSTAVYMDLTSTEGVMLIAVATDAAQGGFDLQ